MPNCTVGTSRKSPISLYYELFGNGSKKVLFVMGFATTWRAWKPQIDAFKQNVDKNISGNVEQNNATNDEPRIKPEGYPELSAEEKAAWNDEYQLCVYDNRGIGKSDCPGGLYSMKTLAQDAYDLLEHLGWTEVHIVGISMGGMISQELALLIINGGRIKMLSLTLSCTHSGGLKSVVPFAGFKAMLKLLFLSKPEERTREALGMVYSQKFLSVKENYDIVFYDGVERSRLDGPAKLKGFFGQLAAITGHYVSNADLLKIKEYGVPVLILTGNDDNLVRPDNSYMLNELLKPAEFIVFEGAGHAINMECRENFNAALFRNFNRAYVTTPQGITMEQQ